MLNKAKGNPGAASFLMRLEAEVLDNDRKAIVIANKIESCNIEGTDLWVLFSDLGSKNMTKVFSICERVPNDTLKDACARQDYSGRKIIEKYIQ
jgi:hypothetical protein